MCMIKFFSFKFVNTFYLKEKFTIEKLISDVFECVS